MIIILFILSFCTIFYTAEAQPLKDKLFPLRKSMVEHDLKGRGIKDQKVLNTFLKVKRELFVRSGWEKNAYEDNPLPIGEGQTISQPYVVALMTEALNLKSGAKVLEIGTGSGYQAAILSELGMRVYSIEIRGKLTEFAKANLKKALYSNVSVKTADGYFGWKEEAPFDGILITCAANHIPPPLKEQLKIGGKLILPLGSTVFFQSLISVTRQSKTTFRSQTLGDVSFVPMTGKAQEPQPPHNK